MKAIMLNGKDQIPELTEVAHPSCPDGHVIVSLRASALNHRDIWIQKGLYAGIRYPHIPGSDGAGFVGEKAVIINPGMNWGEDHRFQGADFKILGMPSDGTFAQEVCVPVDNVYPMPTHLSMEEAAAIPLAGVTAYRALFTQGKFQSGETVLITGIGGGVAQWAFQFAKEMSTPIWVTSSSNEKINQYLKEGAVGGINYSLPSLDEQLKLSDGFDLVIDGAGGGFIQSILKYLKPGARIVIYGGTAGAIPQISPQILFWKQISVSGSTMGSPSDFKNMLELINSKKIVPSIDRIYRLEAVDKAYERLGSGKQSGKIILQIPV